MKPLENIYHKPIQEFDQKDWPNPGEIYIHPDPQRRLGKYTWVVSVMGYGTLNGDTLQKGLFWSLDNAILFRNALVLWTKSDEDCEHEYMSNGRCIWCGESYDGH